MRMPSTTAYAQHNGLRTTAYAQHNGSAHMVLLRPCTAFNLHAHCIHSACGPSRTSYENVRVPVGVDSLQMKL